jgi:Skp family chaperone for outer membrane proteins
MTDQPDAAGIDAGSSGTPADPTVGQPDYKALYEAAQSEVQSLKGEDWFKRFTGLQGLHQREQEKWKKEQSLMDALKSENETLKTQFGEVETKTKTFEEQLHQIRSELDTKSTQLERISTITKKYPTLLEFIGVDEEGNEFDLLPQGTGEELEKALAAFSDRIGKLAPKDQKRPVEGASPRGPAPDQSTGSTLWAQALDALAKGDVVAYDAFYKQHLDSLK